MISPAQFHSFKLKKFCEQCRNLELLIDEVLSSGRLLINTDGKYTEEVMNKVKSRYERLGWTVNINKTVLLFRILG